MVERVKPDATSKQNGKPRLLATEVSDNRGCLSGLLEAANARNIDSISCLMNFVVKVEKWAKSETSTVVGEITRSGL